MAKIKIMGVRKGEQNYQVHVALAEPVEVEGKMVDNLIGEAFVQLEHGWDMNTMKDRIVDAAQRIMDAHKDAKNKRKDLEELEFPEIT